MPHPVIHGLIEEVETKRVYSGHFELDTTILSWHAVLKADIPAVIIITRQHTSEAAINQVVSLSVSDNNRREVVLDYQCLVFFLGLVTDAIESFLIGGVSTGFSGNPCKAVSLESRDDEITKQIIEKLTKR